MKLNLPQDEELLFDVKQKFLRQIPHPTIIRKQIERLAKPLGIELDFNFLPDENDVELDEFLQSYISALMPLKLKIANSENEEMLCSNLKQLWLIHTKLIHKLSIFIIDFKNEKFATVKMSTPFDAYQLLKFLSTSKTHESEINSYLCAAFEKQDSELISILTQSVVRAKKIINYEQVR